MSQCHTNVTCFKLSPDGHDSRSYHPKVNGHPRLLLLRSLPPNYKFNLNWDRKKVSHNLEIPFLEAIQLKLMMRIRDRPSEHSPIYSIIRYSEGKDTLAVVTE